MRRADPDAALNAEQRAAADAGIKAMIPLPRPFLEYVLSALADAGITDVCVVIGPDHDIVRRHFERDVRVTRVRLEFAIQQEPRGSADAFLATEGFASGEHVVLVNSDNYYPVHALKALRELGAGGVAAFERDALIRLSNIEPERVRRYSVIETDDRGMLRRIVEKPEPGDMGARGDVLVGMNSWSLPPQIYDACRRIPMSPRGEMELPHAVQYAIEHLGVAIQVLRFQDAVLDLSSRADIAAVSGRLEHVVPRL